MSEQEILSRVLENTEVIKKQTAKVAEENRSLKAKEAEKENEEEKRKEQNRVAQKNFKKIGCNVKEEVADKFEELAHKLGFYNTSAMCKAYLLLLLENKEYQKTFVEYSAVLAAEENGEA